MFAIGWQTAALCPALAAVCYNDKVNHQTAKPMSSLFIQASDMTADEQQAFKDWARNNYEPFSPISGVWHPIIQRECTIINEETKVSLS
jgi:hypothetical protein